MKTLNYALIVLLFLGLSSCKDDDGGGTTPVTPAVNLGFISFNKDATVVTYSPASVQSRSSGSETVYNISSASQDLTTGFSILFDDSQYQVGTQDLGDVFSGKAYATYTEGDFFNQKTYNSVSGTVTISEINTQTNLVKGSFQFIGEEFSQGDSINFTNGTFEVLIL